MKVVLMRYIRGFVNLECFLFIVKDVVFFLRVKVVIYVGICIGFKFEEIKLGDVVIFVKVIIYGFNVIRSGDNEFIDEKYCMSRYFFDVIRGVIEVWKVLLRDYGIRDVKVYCDV